MPRLPAPDSHAFYLTLADLSSESEPGVPHDVDRPTRQDPAATGGGSVQIMSSRIRNVPYRSNLWEAAQHSISYLLSIKISVVFDFEAFPCQLSRIICLSGAPRLPARAVCRGQFSKNGESASYPNCSRY